MAVSYDNFMMEIAKSGNLFKARFNSMETVKKLLDEIPSPYGTLKIGAFPALRSGPKNLHTPLSGKSNYLKNRKDKKMSNLGDDNTETLARKWAEELKQKKDWGVLAAYCCAYYSHPTEEGLSYDESVDLWNHQRNLVMEILREAGAEAVDDIILALERGENKDLKIALLLEDIGGTKAAPILKKLYEKGVWDGKGDEIFIYKFLQEVDLETRQKAEDLLRDQEQRRINAQKEVAAYTESEMITLLQQLCEAWAENRPKTSIIEMEAKALAIGERLSSKGGIDEMKRIFLKASGTRALEGFWHGIGGWMG